MTTPTSPDISKLEKRLDKLERIVHLLVSQLDHAERQIRTLKSAQHQQTNTIASIQRRG